MQTNEYKNDRVLRISEVIQVTGLSRTGIYEGVKANTFPAPLKLSIRSSGWLLSEVNNWLQERVDARREAANG